MSASRSSLARQRWRINGFIAAVILVQLAIPLTYYLGERDADERFSWRMFSSVRLHRCQIRIQDVALRSGRKVVQPVSTRQLRQELPVAWITLLTRFRPAVVERFLDFRCHERELEEVRYLRRCITPGDEQLPPDRYRMRCSQGRMRALDGSRS